MLRLIQVAALLAIALFAAPLAAQTVTTSPANSCTRTLSNGSRSCSVTVTWDKQTATNPYYSLWYSVSDQRTGSISAPYPGVMVGCGVGGTGTYAYPLTRAGIYRYGLWGSSLPCAFQGNPSSYPAFPLIPLAEAFLVVQ